MRRFAVFATLALAPLLAPASAFCQSESSLLERGQTAFREARYEEAARILEQASAEDPLNAEAHYLLARLYTETPLQNRKKAESSLEAALNIEPDNVQFLVARLDQLRADSWNFITDRIREIKRSLIAGKILEIDPENAFAHEEMGVIYIHDFWKYRNALMAPILQGGVGSLDESERVSQQVAQEMDETYDPGSPFAPGSVFLADRFDMQALEALDVPVRDLSGRAERAYEHAIGHLHQALASDPRRRTVYDHLMRIYALKGEYEDALQMLQQMYIHYAEDPSLWTYLGLAHYRQGQMEAASKSFETGFRYMMPDVQEAYQNLDDILPDDEKKQYKEDPVAYASRFWTSKDPRHLTPYNERKLEHFARLTYADLLYGAPDLNLRGWQTERGQILVRYGLPRIDAVIVPSQAPTRNAWNDLSSDLEAPEQQSITGTAVQFVPVATADPTNALALKSQLEEFDMPGEMNTFNIWDYGDFKFVFEDPFRNGEYRLYSPSAQDIAGGMEAWLNDYVLRARETFRKLPDRYEYRSPARQIEMPYTVNAFKGAGNETDLYVHYGIPIVGFDPSKEMVELTANLGTFLINESRDILVERRRTIYGLQTAQIIPFEQTNLWVDSQQMTAPPGEQEISVEFETAGGGTVAVQRKEVTVPDFTTNRLALSDLLLAYRVEESPEGAPAQAGDVVRHGFSISPAPWSVFPNGRPIYLYFEAYHLAQDENGKTDYEVEVLLTPQDEAKGIGRLFKGLFGRGKGVSVRYSGSGSVSDEAQYQILDAQGRSPGAYTVLLHLRDNIARKTVVSQKELYLDAGQ